MVFKNINEINVNDLLAERRRVLDEIIGKVVSDSKISSKDNEKFIQQVRILLYNSVGQGFDRAIEFLTNPSRKKG